MNDILWIKFYLDMFDKPKINKIRRLPNGDSILLFWIMLLATAGKCNAGGMIFITEQVPFTKEDLADEFDLKITTVELALHTFKELGMIELMDNGSILVINWDKYQSEDKLTEIREGNRLRQQKSRERRKLLNSANGKDISGDIDVIFEDLSRDSHVTSHSIEEDKEKEEEKEEKEQKISSSFLPREEENIKKEYVALVEGKLSITEEEFMYLWRRLTYDELKKYAGIVYDCEKNGKQFTKKTHAQAILDMAMKDRKAAPTVKRSDKRTKETPPGQNVSYTSYTPDEAMHRALVRSYENPFEQKSKE
jgi:predicted phage replisome organizer